MQKRVQELNKLASDAAFAEHNERFSPDLEGEIMDLHGLHVREAEQRVAQRIGVTICQTKGKSVLASHIFTQLF